MKAQENTDGNTSSEKSDNLPDTGQAESTGGLIASIGFLLAGLMTFVFTNRRKENN